jgi:thioredoxin 1
MSIETNDVNFRKDVLDSNDPVLVDFWAPWCGPCRMVGPVIDRLGEKVKGKAKVYKVNVDENPQTSSQFGISCIPTVIVFKNGKISKTLLGVQPEQEYLNALNIQKD